MSEFIDRVLWKFFKHCKHDFEMIYSHYSKDGCFKNRHVVFECKQCHEIEKYRRWAFCHGAGALCYFYDKEWEYRQDEFNQDHHPDIKRPGFVYLTREDGRWRLEEKENV